jgi:hypothetical protein
MSVKVRLVFIIYGRVFNLPISILLYVLYTQTQPMLVSKSLDVSFWKKYWNKNNSTKNLVSFPTTEYWNRKSLSRRLSWGPKSRRFFKVRWKMEMVMVRILHLKSSTMTTLSEKRVGNCRMWQISLKNPYPRVCPLVDVFLLQHNDYKRYDRFFACTKAKGKHEAVF